MARPVHLQDHNRPWNHGKREQPARTAYQLSRRLAGAISHPLHSPMLPTQTDYRAILQLAHQSPFKLPHQLLSQLVVHQPTLVMVGRIHPTLLATTFPFLDKTTLNHTLTLRLQEQEQRDLYLNHFVDLAKTERDIQRDTIISIIVYISTLAFAGNGIIRRSKAAVACDEQRVVLDYRNRMRKAPNTITTAKP